MNDHVQEEVKFPKGSRIIPIHPLAKYVIMVPRDLLPEDDEGFEDRMHEMAINITEWWDDSNPFMILTDEMTLVKIGEVDLLLEEDDGEEKT